MYFYHSILKEYIKKEYSVAAEALAMCFMIDN